MSEMIERMARAHYSRTIEIVAVTRPGAPFIAWEELPEEQRRICLAGTRASIEVLREPTLEQRTFLEGKVGIAWIKGWHTMIDEALK